MRRERCELYTDGGSALREDVKRLKLMKDLACLKLAVVCSLQKRATKKNLMISSPSQERYLISLMTIRAANQVLLSPVSVNDDQEEVVWQTHSSLLQRLKECIIPC